MAPDGRRQRKPAITMSREDHERLTRMAESLANSNPDLADDLFGELDRARLVDSLDRRPEIVRMGSTLRFTTDAGEDRTVTLVFPAEADIAEGRISVLTPIGIALIGLEAGQSMDWTARDGRVHRLTVESVDGAPGVPPDAPQTELRAAS
jgi:regulator of nucleoside diphosphate kinase